MTETCPWSLTSSLLYKRQQDDKGKLLLTFLRDSFQQSFNRKALGSSLATSFGISFAIFILFCLIRPHNATVYAPRLKYSDEKHAPPPIEPGFLAWLKPVFKTHEDELVDKIGLDATVFLRFVRMLRNIFGALSIFAFIMIAVNAGCTAKQKSNSPEALDPFVYMSPQLISGKCLSAHVLMAWIYDLIVAYFIWRSYQKIVKLKINYFESEEYKTSLYAKTLMVTDVPRPYRSNDGLGEIVREVKVDPRVHDDMKARIARDMKELPRLVKEHEHTVRKLESVLARYLNNPDHLPPNRPTMKVFKDDRKAKGNHRVDAIEYLDERLKMLETRIKEVRGSIDLKMPLPYGFVSFSTIQNAHTVAYAAKGKKPEGAKIRLAPKVIDLLWKNLAKSKRQRRWNRTWGWMLYILLTVVWVVPNAFIATFLTNISAIGALWKAFDVQFRRNIGFWALIQGFAAPLVTSLVFLLLPTVMRRISARQGDITKTARERHTLAKLFSFFVFNNLLVFTIFGTFWSFIAQVKDQTGGVNKTNVWKAIAEFGFATQSLAAIFNVSRFWVMYLLQRNLGALLDLIQFYTLFMRWYSRQFSNPTPRELIEWSAPPPMDFASYYIYFLFYATIAFTFAPVQPLVLPVACLYFTIDSFFRKYAFMYMFATKNESGGMFWRVLVNRVLVAACFGNVVTAVIVWVRYNAGAAIGALLPILGLIGFKVYCIRVFDNKLSFYRAVLEADLDHAEGGDGRGKVGNVSEAERKGHRNDRLSDRYGHPALTRKLMTPLVHDKVKHLLARVYSIRNEEESSSSGGTPPAAASPFRENVVGMVGMQNDKVGLQSQPTGLEHYGFVEEHQLDYNNLQGQQRQEFGYIFETGTRPQTPGALSIGPDSRPQTPGVPTGGPGAYTQTNRARYSTLGSPGLGPQQLTLSTGRAVSPLVGGANTAEYGYSDTPADNVSNGGYFQQHPVAADSDSDLARLLKAPQQMGSSTLSGDGYDNRPSSSHSYDYNGSYPQQPQQQPQQQQPPPGYQGHHSRPQSGSGWGNQGNGPSGYETFRKG
ncbi:hypothetical protein ABW20_dc0102639 [Dactylellina cionopaga]|nr:hypothetical protein ABW20_dc0102639 [Dactylellina cionopaga]